LNQVRSDKINILKQREMGLLCYKIEPNGRMTPHVTEDLELISNHMQIFHHGNLFIHILKYRKAQPGKNKSNVSALISFICGGEPNRGVHFVYALHATVGPNTQHMVDIAEVGAWLREMNLKMSGALPLVPTGVIF
jgi:hypothetical protein